MIILFMMIPLSFIIGINAVILFLIQPGEMFYTRENQKVSFTSVFVGVFFSMILILVIVSVFWLYKWENDPLFPPFFMFIFFAILVICCITNLLLKLFYDYLLFKLLRKIKKQAVIKVMITRTKIAIISLIVGICLLVYVQQVVNESKKDEHNNRKYKDDIEMFENALKSSLQHNAVVLSYDYERGYDGFSWNVEVKGNEQFFQKLLQRHSFKEEQGEFIVEVEYGRGHIDGSCKREMTVYMCSFNTSQLTSR